jgi:hypothetical protein
MNTGDTIFKNTFYFKKKKAFCPLLTRSEIAVEKFPPQHINRPKYLYSLTVVGELGRYPLYIDIVISMIKYWIRLHEDKTNCILKAALDEVIDKVIFTLIMLTL